MIDEIRRVAVTGAAGYVARTLMARLARDDAVERILALDVRQLPAESAKGPVVFERRDVTLPFGPLLWEHHIDALAHLAYVMRPSRDREFARRVNVDGTASTLASCEDAGVRHMLYLSSTSIYGAHPDNPPLLGEEAPPRPPRGFQYSEDKAAAERLIADFAASRPNFSAVVLRACPALGPRADNFIASAFSKPFLVGARGHDPQMQLVHEDDLAEAMSRCLLSRVSGTYNLTGDGLIRWSEMARMFGRRVLWMPRPLLRFLAGASWALRLQNDSPPSGLDFITHSWAASNDRARRELGIRPRHTSREAWAAFAERNRVGGSETLPGKTLTDG